MATSQGSAVERAEEMALECRHHWIIDAAGGPTSKGVCRVCGAQRQFRNYLEDAPWDDGNTSREPVVSLLSSASSIDAPEEES